MASIKENPLQLADHMSLYKHEHIKRQVQNDNKGGAK